LNCVTLLVKGPETRVTIEGHPILFHDGLGVSLWTVALTKATHAEFLLGLNQMGLEVLVAHDPEAPIQLWGQFSACQTCAFHDPLSPNQCGMLDWDPETRAIVATTPDGQRSLDQCPVGRKPQ
jgi:hypothetical protein